MTQCILDDLMFSRAACPCAREATVAPSTLVIVVLEGWRHQAGQSSAMFPSVSRGSPDITRVSAGKLTFRGCSSNSGGAIKVTAGGVTRRCRWHQEKRTFLMSEGCSPCSLGIWCYRSKKVKQDAWISAKLIQMISIYCNLLCVGTLRLNFRTAPSSSRIALQILAELSAFLAVGNNDCQIHARCFGPMEHSESPRVGRRRGNGRSLFEVTKRSLRSALVISSTAPALAPSVVAGLWRRLVALWKWRVRNRCLSNMAALKIFAWAAWVCIFAIVIQKKNVWTFAKDARWLHAILRLLGLFQWRSVVRDEGAAATRPGFHSSAWWQEQLQLPQVVTLSWWTAAQPAKVPCG